MEERAGLIFIRKDLNFAGVVLKRVDCGVSS
jgi:hypothetical protein